MEDVTDHNKTNVTAAFHITSKIKYKTVVKNIVCATVEKGREGEGGEGEGEEGRGRGEGRGGRNARERGEGEGEKEWGGMSNFINKYTKHYLIQALVYIKKHYFNSLLFTTF